MAAGYYVPSYAMHCFAMFGPSLLFGSTYHRIIILLLFTSGPLMTEWLVWGGGQAVRRLEWPSIWCLFAAAQVGYDVHSCIVCPRGVLKAAAELQRLHGMSRAV
jgi:hypothetical protein